MLFPLNCAYIIMEPGISKSKNELNRLIFNYLQIFWISGDKPAGA